MMYYTYVFIQTSFRVSNFSQQFSVSQKMPFSFILWWIVSLVAKTKCCRYICNVNFCNDFLTQNFKHQKCYLHMHDMSSVLIQQKHPSNNKNNIKKKKPCFMFSFVFISLGIAVCYQCIGIWILKLNGKAKISKYDTYSLLYPIYIKKYIYNI